MTERTGPSRASITRRLIAALTGTVVVFWLIAVGIGVYVVNKELSETFDGALQETAERLMPLVLDDLANRDPSSDPQSLKARLRTFDLVWVMGGNSFILRRAMRA